LSEPSQGIEAIEEENKMRKRQKREEAKEFDSDSSPDLEVASIKSSE